MKMIKTIRILLVIWTAIIFMNSLMTADISSEQSGFVTNLALSIFGFFGFQPDAITLQSIIRMTAHAVEFMILGVVIHLDRKTIDYPFYRMFIIGLCIALTDEIIQIFVPGRAFELLDLLIDTLGLTLGIYLVLYVFRIQKRKRRQSLDGNHES
jgi:VanZ family protein